MRGNFLRVQSGPPGSERKPSLSGFHCVQLIVTVLAVWVCDLNAGVIAEGIAPTVLELEGISLSAASQITSQQNETPTISNVENQIVVENTAIADIPFTIADPQAPATLLKLQASSSNQGIVRDSDMQFGGSGAQRFLRITRFMDQIGDTTISVTVQNSLGRTRTITFALVVIPESSRLLQNMQCVNPFLQGDPYTVTFGNNRFIMVGQNGVVRTSFDGISWAKQASNGSAQLRGVTYGGGLYVAVGERGAVVSSGDGTNWTSQTAGTTTTFQRVIYGRGRFVAVGKGGMLAVSTNGIAWQSRKLPVDSALRGACFENGIFVVVGDTGKIFTSVDAENWQSRNSGTTADLTDIAFGNGVFVAIAELPDSARPAAIIYSRDGFVWKNANTASLPKPVHFLYGIAFGNGMFIAVGINNNRALVSTDGITWNSVDGPNVYSLAFGNGAFIGVGQVGEFATSTSGLKWDRRSFGTFFDLHGIVYAGNQFVTVGGSTLVSLGGAAPNLPGQQSVILTSEDGNRWTQRSSPANTELTGISYGGGRYVAVGYSGRIITSANGATWEPSFPPTTEWLYGITFGNGTFVCVGTEGAILTSSDSRVWQKRVSGTDSWLESVTFGNGIFVAVGYGGVILSSNNGITWTPHTLAGTPHLTSVAFGNGLYIATDAVGNARVSGNGSEWKTVPIAPKNYLESISFLDGTFLVSGFSLDEENTYYFGLWSSSDGETWTRHSHGVGNRIFAMARNREAFVGVGYRGVFHTAHWSPSNALSLTSPTRVGTAAHWPQPTDRGRRYTLQFKNSLTESAWTSLPSLDGDGSVKVLSDRDATAPQRFYRLRAD